MTERISNDLLLEHLRAIHAQLKHMDERMRNVEISINILKTHVSGFMQSTLQSEIRQDADLAAMQAQIDRIERDRETGN